LKRKLEVQLVVPQDYEGFVKALHQLSHGQKSGFTPHPNGNGNSSDRMDVSNLNVIDTLD
jgi:hypothetical protein